MTDTYFQLWYIQTSSRNAVNKKLFLTSLLFLARSPIVQFVDDARVLINGGNFHRFIILNQYL